MRRHGRQQCRLHWEVRPPGHASACASSPACSSWCSRARTCRRALVAAWLVLIVTQAGTVLSLNYMLHGTVWQRYALNASISLVQLYCLCTHLCFRHPAHSCKLPGLTARRRVGIHRRGDNCQRRHRRARRWGEQGRCRGFLLAVSTQRHLHLLALCSSSGGCAVCRHVCVSGILMSVSATWCARTHDLHTAFPTCALLGVQMSCWTTAQDCTHT